MATFNLVEERWIPCLMPDASLEAFGLKEVFDRAHDIRQITSSSPLVTAALHRLLLAVLHRVFGPKNLKQWRKLWEEGRFSQEKIGAYLEKWRQRFDLFDEKCPFYQVNGLDADRRVSVTRLCLETPSGSGTSVLLFNHTANEPPPKLAPGEAARHLVAYQCFATGGLITDEAGKASAKAAPLARGAVILVSGTSLFRTLLLNLHIYNPDQEEPFPVRGEDAPAWERHKPTRFKDRGPAGYLDLLTWQSRRILLEPVQEDGRTFVERVVIMGGNQFPKNYSIHDRETMMAFRRNPKAKEGQDPWPPVKLDEQRALWRDSLALVQSVRKIRARPKTLDQLSDLVSKGSLPRSNVFPLAILGESTDQKKIVLWRHERLPLPLAYLSDDELVGALEQALELGEEAGRALRWAGSETAKHLDAQLGGSRDKKQSRISLNPGRLYWSRLETSFKRLMVALPEDRQEVDGETVYGAELLREWAGEIRRTALGAFEEATRGLDGHARALRAAAKGQRVLLGKLKGALGSVLSEGGEG